MALFRFLFAKLALESIVLKHVTPSSSSVHQLTRGPCYIPVITGYCLFRFVPYHPTVLAGTRVYVCSDPNDLHQYLDSLSSYFKFSLPVFECNIIGRIGNCPQTPTMHNNITPVNHRCIVGDEDSGVSVWELERGWWYAAQVLGRHESSVESVVVSTDGRIF